MNEETIIRNDRNVETPQQESKPQKGQAWKHVILGGIPGILVGAGAMYAGTAIANETEKPVEEVPQDDANNATTAAVEEVQVAQVSDGLSFGEAFAAARAAVGPGGVFYWNGGIYGTYYEDEWNAMTDAQKLEFQQRVNPEIHANAVSTPTDSQPQVVVVERIDTSDDLTPENIHQTSNAETTGEDVSVADSEAQEIAQQLEDNFAVSDDVHIVGYAEADGHLVVGYDMDNDSQADVALIDVDDSGTITEPDVIIDTDGNVATIGDAANVDPATQASLENPDVAEDMPDYMNDAEVYDA